MHNDQVLQLIKKYEDLFWYTPKEKKENMSEALIVETILNYGDMDAVKELFDAMGKEKVASVFFSAKGRKKMNYYPEIHNLFTLYFQKYVS